MTDSNIQSMSSKVDITDLMDAINDVMDKCNDIKEVVDEINNKIT